MGADGPGHPPSTKVAKLGTLVSMVLVVCRAGLKKPENLQFLWTLYFRITSVRMVVVVVVVGKTGMFPRPVDQLGPA